MTDNSISQNGYVQDIEKATLENTDFRQVLFTGPKSQLVVMSLKPNEDIGVEVHNTVDQFIRIEQGSGKVILDGEETEVKAEFAIVIPAGTEHNLVNTSDTEDLKLYTVYSPANHPENTVHKTKEEAEKYEEEHHE